MPKKPNSGLHCSEPTRGENPHHQQHYWRRKGSQGAFLSCLMLETARMCERCSFRNIRTCAVLMPHCFLMPAAEIFDTDAGINPIDAHKPQPGSAQQQDLSLSLGCHTTGVLSRISFHYTTKQPQNPAARAELPT